MALYTPFLSSVFLRHISLTLPATFRGRNSTRADYEYQHSNLYAISGRWATAKGQRACLCPGHHLPLRVSLLMAPVRLVALSSPARGLRPTGSRPPLSSVSLQHLVKGQNLSMF